MRAISEEIPQSSITKICLKITFFPGAKELSCSLIIFHRPPVINRLPWCSESRCPYPGYTCYNRKSPIRPKTIAYGRFLRTLPLIYIPWNMLVLTRMIAIVWNVVISKWPPAITIGHQPCNYIAKSEFSLSLSLYIYIYIYIYIYCITIGHKPWTVDYSSVLLCCR